MKKRASLLLAALAVVAVLCLMVVALWQNTRCLSGFRLLHGEVEKAESISGKVVVNLGKRDGVVADMWFDVVRREYSSFWTTTFVGRIQVVQVFEQKASCRWAGTSFAVRKGDRVETRIKSGPPEGGAKHSREKILGAVRRVDNPSGLVLIDGGENIGVTEQMFLQVLRPATGEYVGRLRVMNVYDEASVCRVVRVVTTFDGNGRGSVNRVFTASDIELGDRVTTALE
ncbi:MAG TPA: hypothetical protein VMZ92_07815 [Planctomycetota bacterium]|nr:hypothetical protein [Planctomycetota bacterium]